MKCKFYSDEIGKCLFDGPPDDCPFENDEDNCACFEPKMIEYGSSDVYDEEDKFYKKYCRGCSSKVCGGVRNIDIREGCRYYRHEMEKETPDNLPSPEGAIPLKGCTIALPKYSARISIGNLQINLTDKTFNEEQIKNMKEMLDWEVENL